LEDTTLWRNHEPHLLTFEGEVTRTLRLWPTKPFLSSDGETLSIADSRIILALEGLIREHLPLANGLTSTKNPGIRHARYHLWEALARRGPRRQTREAFIRLLQQSGFLADWPPRRKYF